MPGSYNQDNQSSATTILQRGVQERLDHASVFMSLSFENPKKTAFYSIQNDSSVGDCLILYCIQYELQKHLNPLRGIVVTLVELAEGRWSHEKIGVQLIRKRMVWCRLSQRIPVISQDK